MIFISPGKEEYGIGNKIPLINIPLNDLDAGEDMSLEDYQWWSYSEDFNKWLKANPREWQAESLDNPDYDSLDESYGISLNESGGLRRFLNFSDFVINEEEPADAGERESDASKETAAKQIKFNYAYHRLLAENVLDKFKASEIGETQKALFMSFAGEEEDTVGIPGTRQAYRSVGIKTGSDELNLISIDYAEPFSGEISQEASLKDVVDNAIKGATQAAIGLGIGLGVWTVAKFVGAGLGARWLLSKTVGNFLNKTANAKRAAALSRLRRIRAARAKVKTVKYLKSGLGGAVSVLTLSKSRAGVGAAIRASRIKNIKPVGILRAFMRGTGLGNLFPKFMGKGAAKVGGKLAGKAIPFVGEVLMAVDAVYSIWSWNRDSQAPKYGEVEDFAFKTFSPKDVKVGVPMTICWSQPSGSWLNWVATDETRTTMEMVKILDSESNSVFIITQANSKGLQKFMGENALLMAVFKSDEKFERGFFDNDDLDFKMIAIEDVTGLISPFIFDGICDWSKYKQVIDDCPDYLLESSEDAPENYELNFEDADGDRINVSGKILPTSAIQDLSEDDLEKIFGYASVSGVSESSRVHLTMSSFLNEEESSVDPTGTIELEPDQQTGPASVAIYVTEQVSYANPALGGTKKSPEFEYFIVAEESLDANEGDPILALPSSDLEFTDALRGISTYVEPQKEPEKEPETPETEDEKEKEESGDDGETTTTPDDVKYKERNRAIVIKDRVKEDGINIMNEFLTDEEKDILQISSWKAITKIRAKRERKTGGEITKITLRNSKAGLGDKVREYTPVDGKSFEVAKKLVDSVKSEVKYV